MIGLGKWTGEIHTSMISGSAIVEIKDNNGQYDFSVTVPNVNTLPDFNVYEVVEKGNTLSGKAKVNVLGTLDVEIFVEFTSETTFIGYIKVPFFGKIEIQNGRKID